VHGGMLKTAELMGLPGKPVHTAVANALRANRGYGECLYSLKHGCQVSVYICVELVLTGHSLGAGIASLLALVCTSIPSTDT
jgi:putative lipase involved disintegration of autophagic bodies